MFNKAMGSYLLNYLILNFKFNYNYTDATCFMFSNNLQNKIDFLKIIIFFKNPLFYKEMMNNINQN